MTIGRRDSGPTIRLARRSNKYHLLRPSTGDRATLKKTLTTAVATLAPTSQAQGGSLGKVVGIGIVGAAIGAIAGAASARAQGNAERDAYRPRRGYGYEAGFRNSSIFDDDGIRTTK